MFTLLRLYFQLPAKGNNLAPGFNIVLRGAGRHAINVTAGAFVGPWEADVCYAVRHKYGRSSTSIAGRTHTHARPLIVRLLSRALADPGNVYGATAEMEPGRVGSRVSVSVIRCVVTY